MKVAKLAHFGVLVFKIKLFTKVMEDHGCVHKYSYTAWLNNALHRNRARGRRWKGTRYFGRHESSQKCTVCEAAAAESSRAGARARVWLCSSSSPSLARSPFLQKMAEAGAGFLEQLKSCIVWSWTYLWTLWFFIMLFLVYILRVPLKISDNLTTGKQGEVIEREQPCPLPPFAKT
ncbi:hypothetical protein EYD10_07292 [Varanus komodoensis]|nr:hypothetical protein EYD10_07292 [Varanus komodoensis]